MLGRPGSVICLIAQATVRQYGLAQSLEDEPLPSDDMHLYRPITCSSIALQAMLHANVSVRLLHAWQST